ncbi:MAG: LysR family transcriptional regulator [Pseudomonadota bacterium]
MVSFPNDSGINPRHLASLAAIGRHGSFAAAGRAVGRSHSAVSLHIKALEETLGTTLVDRRAKPAVLTADGLALAEHAERLARVIDDIRAIGSGGVLAGRLTAGIVPTAMIHLAPHALALLQAEHPNLGIDIRTGLSGELAAAVRSGELDAAVVTAPDTPAEDLEQRAVAEEPLVVIAPAHATEPDDAGLLSAHPFIWFSRKTWAGQQIERRLLDRGVATSARMEVDSLEAIHQLVRHGLGVSVVPDAGPPQPGLRSVPFGRPQAKRRLVLLTRPSRGPVRQIDALLSALRQSAVNSGHGSLSTGKR